MPSFFIILFSRSKVLLTSRPSASTSNNSPDIIATEYWNKPSREILDPWGIDPVVIVVISVIVTGSTTETVEGFMLPWRLKFTQYRNPVVVETCIDAGNKPSVVSPNISLFSVEYLTNLPKGLPWANERYQNLPFGSTVIPCGPSISVG